MIYELLKWNRGIIIIKYLEVYLLANNFNSSDDIKRLRRMEESPTQTREIQVKEQQRYFVYQVLEGLQIWGKYQTQIGYSRSLSCHCHFKELRLWITFHFSGQSPGESTTERPGGIFLRSILMSYWFDQLDIFQDTRNCRESQYCKWQLRECFPKGNVRNSIECSIFDLDDWEYTKLGHFPN